MKLISKQSLCLLVCLMFMLSSFSQEKQQLQDIISNIESEHDVKFSYTESDVRGINLVLPKTLKGLTKKIEYLNASTLLNFKFISERYITISTIDKRIKVCGKIVINDNKEPLYGASVVQNNTTNGVVSDIYGAFELNDVAVNSDIVISYLGFKTFKIKAQEIWHTNGCETIQLIENSEELEQVVISKYLTTGIQKQNDGSVVLYTEKFGILPGLTEPDVLQSIQALPGVESINESIANINVRGGTNDQNFILWDGIKMYHSGHFFGLISAYNPYLTEKVKVTKNGTSAEFGDGVSSTLNMLTSDEVNAQFSGGFGANLLHADAYFKIPVSKKLAFHVSGRRSYTDLFSSPTYDNYFERSFQDSDLTLNSSNGNNQDSDFFFYDYSAKLLFDFNENHKFRANVIGIFNNLDYAESITNNNNQTQSRASNLKQENLGFGGSWNANWNPKFSTELSTYYTTYEVNSKDERIETQQTLNQINEVLETSIKLKGTYNLNDQTNLFAGYQFYESGILNRTEVINPDFQRTQKDVLLNHVLFAETEFKTTKAYLRAGVRLNYFEKFDELLFEPRLNFRYKMTNRLAFQLQGELKNQSTSQVIDFQDDFLGVENRRWVLANETTIPIAKSKQASAGFEYNANNWVLDVQGFYKSVDGITVSNQGFYNNFQFVNAIGSYNTKGVELLLNKTADKFSTWLSYTYALNDYEFSSLTPSVFPNNADIRHSVSMAFNYDILNNLQASIGGIWRSGQPFTVPVEGNETVQNGNNSFVNYSNPNAQNLEDFQRIDVSLAYNFNLSETIKSTLRVGVLNVLSRKNDINTYFEVDPNDENSAIKIENKSLGLTPNVSFRCKF